MGDDLQESHDDSRRYRQSDPPCDFAGFKRDDQLSRHFGRSERECDSAGERGSDNGFTVTITTGKCGSSAREHHPAPVATPSLAPPRRTWFRATRPTNHNGDHHSGEILDVRHSEIFNISKSLVKE